MARVFKKNLNFDDVTKNKGFLGDLRESGRVPDGDFF